MNQRHPLLKFIVFGIACLLAAGWLIQSIGNLHPFTDFTGYAATFSDVQGLAVNDAVKIAGVSVGKVTDIGVDHGRAVVHFTVRRDVRLGKQSSVMVRWRNTIGLRFIYVQPAGEGTLPAGYRFPNEATSSPVDVNALLARMTPAMRALDPKITNVIVEELVKALKGREQKVRSLVANAGDLFETLATRDAEVGRVLSNGATLMDAYAKREAQLKELVARFANVSESIASRNDVLVQTVDELTKAQGELERLLSTNEDDIGGLLDGLDVVSKILSANHDNLEKIVTWTGTGIIQYHRISRWGQWFNIRVPGVSEGEDVISTERGASMPPRQGGGGGSQTSPARFDPTSTSPIEPWTVFFEGAVVGGGA